MSFISVAQMLDELHAGKLIFRVLFLKFIVFL